VATVIFTVVVSNDWYRNEQRKFNFICYFLLPCAQTCRKLT